MGSFWWKSNLALIDQYKAIARCNVGDGKTSLFWDDLWHLSILKHKYHHLHSSVKNPQINVQTVVNIEYLQYLFYLPLTTEAYEEFLQMEHLCISLRQSEYIDSWTLGVIYGEMNSTHLSRLTKC